MRKLLHTVVVVIDANTPRSHKDVSLAATDVRANSNFSIGSSDLGVPTLVTPTTVVSNLSNLNIPVLLSPPRRGGWGGGIREPERG